MIQKRMKEKAAFLAAALSKPVPPAGPPCQSRGPRPGKRSPSDTIHVPTVKRRETGKMNAPTVLREGQKRHPHLAGTKPGHPSSANLIG